jgi:hypothetical protein
MNTGIASQTVLAVIVLVASNARADSFVPASAPVRSVTVTLSTASGPVNARVSIATQDTRYFVFPAYLLTEAYVRHDNASEVSNLITADGRVSLDSGC